MAIAEDRGQALGDHPVDGQLARQALRDSKALELAMQPVGEFLVLVAVAQESEIAHLRANNAMNLGSARRLRRAVVGRHSGKLGHRRPPSIPATLVNTMR